MNEVSVEQLIEERVRAREAWRADLGNEQKKAHYESIKARLYCVLYGG